MHVHVHKEAIESLTLCMLAWVVMAEGEGEGLAGALGSTSLLSADSFPVARGEQVHKMNRGTPLIRTAGLRIR